MEDQSSTTLLAEGEPQTPVQGGEDELRVWLDGARELQARQITDQAAALGIDDEGAAGSALGPAPPLSSFYAYSNSRPGVDGNTCGQAAIGSMLDFYGKDPFGLPRVAGHWRSAEIIDALKNAGWGPDVLGGVFGTSPTRMRDALRAYGVPRVSSGHSGLFFSGWPNQWNRLLAYVYYSAIPVPVLVGTSGFGAHWPIVWKMRFTGQELLLYLANWSASWGPNPMPKSNFLARWACGGLPLGFNHAAIYTGEPKVSF